MDKLDKIEEHLANIDKTLIRNTVTLEEHIKRTALLERDLINFHGDIRPNQKHVDRVEGAVKLFILVSGATGLAMFIAKMLH